MASASSLLAMSQCSICLDVFKEPVSTPCGHNYCKSCITRYWDTHDQCCCPLCKKYFVLRPDLLVNTLISEMSMQLRKKAALKVDLSTNTDGPNQGAAPLKEVPCDVCPAGIQLQALKSCLVCLTSYCETHLEPHRRVAALQRHKLIHPGLLELFRRTDQPSACVTCTEHKTHDRKEGYEKTNAQLETKKTEVEQMIQVRLQKIQEIKCSAVLTEQEMVDCIEIVTALVASIQKSQAELIDLMEAERRAVKKQAEGFISALEQEITELQKSRVEMEKLSHNKDHLHFFTPMITKDWSEVSVSSHLCGGPVSRALEQLEETLCKETKMLLKRMEDMVDLPDLPEDVKLKRIQQRYAVDVTLDPGTAHRRLFLSDNRKRVRNAEGHPLPTYPDRFEERYSVLAKEGFSAGRFYYQVQVGGKTQWEVGLVRQSITRKWITRQNPETGYWIIRLRDGRCSAVGHRSIPLLRGSPEKIGVFVDYEEGLISFYDVEAKHLLFSFSDCTFTEKMYPYLRICPYDQHHPYQTPRVISNI